MINMILLPEPQNTKTGNIIQSYSSPVLSPDPSRKAGAMRRIPMERADNREDNRFIGCQDDLANALTGALWLDKGESDEILLQGFHETDAGLHACQHFM